MLAVLTSCLATAAQASAAEEGAISGQVTSALTKSGLAGIEVCATRQFESFEFEYYEYFESEYLGRCETTTTGGSYTISGLSPGSFGVEFRVPTVSSLNYRPQFYNGRASRAEQQLVPVTSGATAGAINAAMQGGAQIGGTVTDAATKAKIAGILVCATERSAEERTQCSLSNASGEYVVPGLVGGEYTVEFDIAPESTLNYLHQYYNAKTNLSEAQPVSVASGGTQSGINAALAQGGQITGAVTDAATKAAISGARVCSYNVAYSERCVLTNASGKYTLTGLRSGSYTVGFASPPESTLNYIAHYTSEVAVTLGAVTSGVNATLESGAQITGKVTSASTKAPLQGIRVCASPATAESYECTTTNASGVYTLRRLATDSYTVEFAAYNAANANYVRQYYKGVSNYEQATPVSATAGAVTSGIDAALLDGGKITGHVTDAATKAALQGIVVCAELEGETYLHHCASTNASGEFHIVRLVTGTYRVQYAPYEYSGYGRYLTQYYKGQTAAVEANPVSVTMGSTTTAIDAALIEAGRIGGTVTDLTTKAAISGVDVCAYKLAGEYVNSCALTTAGGGYEVLGLPTGEYRVSFYDAGYVYQYYNAKTASGEANPVMATNGKLTAGINAALQLGGKITGTVTDAVTKVPIENINVCALTSGGEYTGQCALSNAAGEYHIEGLPTGAYKIEFAAYYSSSANYLPQYYNAKATFGEAETVSVTAGSVTSGINDALREAGKITGKVTDASTKAAIAGIQVCALGSASGCVSTNASGEYTITRLATGSYTVEFYSSVQNYVTQYYNGKTEYAQANPVAVTAGSVTSGIDAALSEAGKITGKVTDASTKAAIAGIQVCAVNSLSGCASTNASGEYTITRLATGSYTVEFYSTGEQNYVTQYYNGKTEYGQANPVAVTTGSVTSGIDAALSAGGKITGKVTDASTKAAIAGIQVCALGSASGCASTNASGEYTITRLPTGSFTVEFYSGSGQNYVTQYYNGKTEYFEANPVAVTAGSVTTGISAALQAGGRLKGTVTSAATKAPLASIEVCATKVGGSYSAGCAVSAGNGEYTIAGLAAGEYRVEFYGSGSAYATQYYNEKPNFSEANLVTVTTGATTSAINAAMGATGLLSGTVTDATTKAGIENIEVCARRHNGEYTIACATTGSGGKYTLSGLPSGEYVIEFAPGSSATSNYARQFYNGKYSFSEATAVQVTSGATTGEINAALIEGGEVSGTVTDAATKAPLSGATVCASETQGEFAARCATTNASGEYTITSLAPGKYRVRFFSSTGEYATQYYDSAASFANAQVVAVANGVDVEGLNAAMGGGGKIAGVVTSASSKAPIAGIGVCAGESCATTNASGEYTLIGLAAGEYVVAFRGNGLNFVPQYYNEKATAAEATHVAVTVHATTGSINAAMHEGGQITGIVTDSSTKAAVSGVSVCAAPHSGGVTSECAQTNAGGEYALAGLPTGSYTVSFEAAGKNYLTQYYNNRSTSGEADAVAVTTGSTTSAINAALLQGGHMRGTVTSASSKLGLGHVQVCTTRRSGPSAGGCSSTNLAGEYEISGLPAGEYTTSFNGSAVGYLTQYYNGKPSAGEATPVTITAGGTTAAINAALEEGGKISGKVTDASSKSAIPAIEIYIFNGAGQQVSSAVTKPNGEYLAEGLPAGEYRLEFVSTSHAYEDQYYNAKTELAKANPVAVTAAGHITPGINAALNLSGGAPSPKIAAVSPNRGTESGGTSVTITGAALGSTSAVSFGGVPATSFTVESTNEVIAKAPAGHATIDIRITTSQGTTPVGLADRYRYLTPEEVELEEAAREALEGKPTVTEVSPGGVLQSGGTVTLTGANYVGVKAVTFGSEPAASFEVNSPTKITALVPALKIRGCAAQVQTSTGTSVVRLDNSLECVPPGAGPTVSALSPKKGPSGGGTQVTVSGTALGGVTQVLVGGQRATQVRLISELSLTAVLPAHAEGTADVIVTTPNGTSAANSKDHYKYGKPIAPTVNYVGRAAGPKAGGTEVTVGGTNFVPGMSFLFGKIPASAAECIATSCKVTAPAAAKTGAVDIIAVVGKSKSKKSSADHYTYE